jgi:hypothetical protein
MGIYVAERTPCPSASRTKRGKEFTIANVIHALRTVGSQLVEPDRAAKA